MTYKKKLFTGLVSGALLVSPFSGLAQTNDDPADEVNPSPYPTKSYPESKKQDEKQRESYHYDPGVDEVTIDANADTENRSRDSSDYNRGLAATADRNTERAETDVQVDVRPADESALTVGELNRDSEVNDRDALAENPSPNSGRSATQSEDRRYSDIQPGVAATSNREIETEIDTTEDIADFEASASKPGENDALAQNPGPNPEKRSMNQPGSKAEGEPLLRFGRSDNARTEAGVRSDAREAADADAGIEVETSDEVADVELRTSEAAENDALTQNPAPNPEKRSVNQSGNKAEGDPIFRSDSSVAEAEMDTSTEIDAQATQPEVQTSTATTSTTTGVAASGNEDDVLESVDDDLELGQSRTAVINAGDTLGWDVVDSDGNKLGDLTDYAIRPEQQEIAYLIVSAGGILGVGGRDHFLELSQVDNINDDNQLVVTISREEFGQLTNIDSSEQDGLIRFFSEVEGEQAVSNDGIEVGSVQDMLVRFEGGNIAHLIINPNTAFTADWGYGFKVAVPASEVMELKGNDELVIGVSRDEVLSAELADNKEDVRLLETSAGNVYRLDLSGSETALRD